MNGTEYEVSKISLLYSVFKRIDNGTIVNVGNSVLSGVWVENVTRSNAMKERLQFSVSSGTSFDDIELLRLELETFVRDPENSRHFQPDVDIQLISVGDLKQLDLRVEILHKSNWAMEQLRAERRSRFMCALLSAMRKVPIDGPAGSGPGAGSINNPNYSVTITDDLAKETRAKFDADKAAKKMPAPSEDLPNNTGVSSSLEILKSLRQRNVAVAEPLGQPRSAASLETARSSITHAPQQPPPGPGFSFV
jgi:small-conductance mechanosensitive channel